MILSSEEGEAGQVVPAATTPFQPIRWENSCPKALGDALMDRRAKRLSPCEPHLVGSHLETAEGNRPVYQ
jgi:hypothetical protein